MRNINIIKALTTYFYYIFFCCPSDFLHSLVKLSIIIIIVVEIVQVKLDFTRSNSLNVQKNVITSESAIMFSTGM